MKYIIHKCFKCDDKLITADLINGTYVNGAWTHWCKYNHISFRYEKEELLIIKIMYPEENSVIFYFRDKYIVKQSRNYEPATVFLPWFNPDLSDYDKLIDKIKTYIIFL